MNRIFRAETVVGLLSAISLFILLLLGYFTWHSEQSRQSHTLFQRHQALQIAQNQIARQMAGLDCEKQIEQNLTRFEIVRCHSKEIVIRFPLGEVIIKKGS